MNGTLFLISYDISDNRRRRSLSRKLEDTCRRVQKSVFETYAADGVINKIIASCACFVHIEDGDSLRVYKLPGNSMSCFASIGGPSFDWKADIIL
jgi:CRISPR-associated endonuclease Cas2